MPSHLFQETWGATIANKNEVKEDDKEETQTGIAEGWKQNGDLAFQQKDFQQAYNCYSNAIREWPPVSTVEWNRQSNQSSLRTRGPMKRRVVRFA